MAEFKDYKTLDVWLKTSALVKDIYILTKHYPKEELFGLVSQMRRSAVSIPSNIAEGIGRNSPNETLHFLTISRGSLFELETQLHLSKNLEFINTENFNLINSLIEECKKLLN
jgi:four helix bundle protein